MRCRYHNTRKQAGAYAMGNIWWGSCQLKQWWFIQYKRTDWKMLSRLLSKLWPQLLSFLTLLSLLKYFTRPGWLRKHKKRIIPGLWCYTCLLWHWSSGIFAKCDQQGTAHLQGLLYDLRAKFFPEMYTAVNESNTDANLEIVFVESFLQTQCLLFFFFLLFGAFVEPLISFLPAENFPMKSYAKASIIAKCEELTYPVIMREKIVSFFSI